MPRRCLSWRVITPWTALPVWVKPWSIRIGTAASSVGSINQGVRLCDGRSARAAVSRGPASRSCLAGPNYASIWAPARGSRSEVVSEAGVTDIVRDVGQQSRYRVAGRNN